MNKFANAIRTEENKTYTENGAEAVKSTGSALLDFFGLCGAIRDASIDRIISLFSEAYLEDPLKTMKCLFYCRDVRGGLGERKVFRTIIRYLAQTNPNVLRPNIPLIPFYGRFDDLFCLLDTDVANDVYKYMEEILKMDIEDKANKKPISLLAKWLPTAYGRNEEVHKLAMKIAHKLGMSGVQYRNVVRDLRKYLDIVERKMSTNKWNQIKYSNVPARASMIYRNAFTRHDEERYRDWLNKVNEGKAKINTGTLYPYDLLKQYMTSFYTLKEYDKTIEAQWKNLPNYLGDTHANCIVIADTSGSMYTNSGGRPFYTAISLAIYFAERNNGPYQGLWMQFNDDSTIERISGITLRDHIANIDRYSWGGTTNLEAAFDQILTIALKYKIPKKDMVKSLIIISDMEINEATVGYNYGNDEYDMSKRIERSWLFYDKMKRKYTTHGYDIPNIVFWNVESRHNVFHTDKDRPGVQLCSGQSASTFKHLMESINLTPVEMMNKVLDSERYEVVTL